MKLTPREAYDLQRQEEAQERERQRVQKAIDSFAEGHAEETWVCPSCSAVVADREKHVKFHDGLNETSRQASRADFKTTPIG